MTATHSDNIRQYVNDMVGLEADISKAIRGQLGDNRVAGHVELSRLLHHIVEASETRLEELKAISVAEGGSVGSAIKEGVMTATGVLAGLYGKVREHPVSRMVRDDIVALTTAATAYGMLLTLALTAGHTELAQLAERGLRECAPSVTLLTRELPGRAELPEDVPLDNGIVVLTSAPCKNHAALNRLPATKC